MPSNDPFAREWKITSFWPPESRYFAIGGTLLIGFADEGQYDVTWRDPEPRIWRITDLPSAGDILEHDKINVRSGRTSHERHVKLWFEDNNKVLKGSLQISPSHSESYGDGPVGTFTAEADEPKEEGVGATRLEESIAV